MAHPRGVIEVELRDEQGRVGGRIELPPGVSGEFVHAGQRRTLHEGTQRV
jgi:hypothetical protein